MAQWLIPPNLHAETQGGPLCPFHEHAIGARDGRIPRYTDSHACVRCVSSLTEGRLSLDVHRIQKSFRRRFLEFWSFVEIDEPDSCWEWRGKTHTRSGSTTFDIPRFWSKGRQFSASRVATWFTWGDVGRLPIKHTCGNNACCNPLHLRVRGVPHYFHNRHIQFVDLEFNSHKLLHETQAFLEVTREKSPRRFQLMERNNKAWIDFRLQSGGPVHLDQMAAQLVADGDEEAPTF